jgi:hypothetical protein
VSATLSRTCAPRVLLDAICDLAKAHPRLPVSADCSIFRKWTLDNIRRVVSQSAQLGNLVFRYWPRAYEVEHGVLRYMFIWAIGRLRDAGSSLRLTSNSVGDLRAVIEAFIDKAYAPNIPEAEPIATHDIAGLTDFLVEGFQSEVIDMVNPLLEALLLRAWDEIEDGDPPDNEAIMRLTASTLM